ncbi:hypothetical protein [uncultured Pantoea sp.]|uniref:hypothetical protein n=1 Tax=Pantoea trifolii TaxID=2968030 RepID=UPI0025E1A5C8|nr:hypothetical protein [uncultured Pantoea sp.]
MFTFTIQVAIAAGGKMVDTLGLPVGYHIAVACVLASVLILLAYRPQNKAAKVEIRYPGGQPLKQGYRPDR